MDKVTGMMREELKSMRDQMETVTCMSLEGREWSISIVEQEEVQDCGDVMYLIVMLYSRVSTPTLGLKRQVFTTLFSLILSYSLVLFCTKQEHYSTRLVSTSLWTQRSVRILLSSPSHV